MTQSGFLEYAAMLSPSNSRKAASYVMAIRILDEIFAVEDVFGLKGASLSVSRIVFFC